MECKPLRYVFVDEYSQSLDVQMFFHIFCMDMDVHHCAYAYEWPTYWSQQMQHHILYIGMVVHQCGYEDVLQHNRFVRILYHTQDKRMVFPLYAHAYASQDYPFA